MFSKYIKYTKGTIGFLPKSPFSLCKSSSKFETFALLNDAIFPVTSRVAPPKFRFVIAWDTKESFPQPLFGGLIMIFLLTVCFNIFNFFIMVKRCVVQFCTDSNKTGRTMQIFPNDANLKRQFVKFVLVKIADFVECSWSRSNILLFVAVIFLPVAVPTIQTLPEANYSEVWKRPLQSVQLSSSKVRGQQRKYKIDLHENVSLIKQQ